eukprot:scaffold9770_cov110-Isochrysis_galbana.AAC.8
MAGSLRLAGGGAHVVGGRAWHRMASTSNLHDIGSFGLELECGERSSTECEKRRTMWSHSHVLTLSAFSVRTSHCVSFRTATRAAAIPVPLPRIPRHGQMKQNILIRRPDGLWRVNARARAARGLCQPEATPPRARYAVAMPDAAASTEAKPASSTVLSVRRLRWQPSAAATCIGVASSCCLARRPSVSERTCSRKRSFPPRLSTRRTSNRTRSGSTTEHRVSVHTTASATRSLSGNASPTPCTTRIEWPWSSSPARRADRRAYPSMESFGSTPTMSIRCGEAVSVAARYSAFGNEPIPSSTTTASVSGSEASSLLKSSFFRGATARSYSAMLLAIP